MKAFLQHDDSGLFYQNDGGWVHDPQEALSFNNAAAAEEFRNTQDIRTAHAVMRIDPSLLTRMSQRAPGIYQSGE
jgi:hypothetical protein